MTNVTAVQRIFRLAPIAEDRAGGHVTRFWRWLSWRGPEPTPSGSLCRGSGGAPWTWNSRTHSVRCRRQPRHGPCHRAPIRRRGHRCRAVRPRRRCAGGRGANIRDTGARAIPWVADVTDEAAVTAAVQRTVDATGRLDALIVNAGGPPTGTFDSIVDDDWSQAFQLLLMSSVHLVRTAVPALRRSRTQQHPLRDLVRRAPTDRRSAAQQLDSRRGHWAGQDPCRRAGADRPRQHHHAGAHSHRSGRSH